MINASEYLHVIKLFSIFLLALGTINLVSKYGSSRQESSFKDDQNLERKLQNNRQYNVDWTLDLGGLESNILESPFLRAGLEQSVKDYINADLECDDDSDGEIASFYSVSFDGEDQASKERRRITGNGKCKGNKTRCKKKVKKSISDAGKLNSTNFTSFKTVAAQGDFCSTFGSLSIFNFFEEVLTTSSSFNYEVNVEVINKLSEELELDYKVNFVPASVGGLNEIQEVGLESEDPKETNLTCTGEQCLTQRNDLINIFSHFGLNFDENKHECLQIGINCDDKDLVTHIWMMNVGIVQKTIPENLKNLRSLRGLFLGGNTLTGSIPFWLMTLPKLEMLWLERNRLTGTIPSNLNSLRGLIQLNLFDNQLSGTIPPVPNKKLELLHLGNNNLHGSMHNIFVDEKNNKPETASGDCGVSFPNIFEDFIFKSVGQTFNIKDGFLVKKIGSFFILMQSNFFLKYVRRALNIEQDTLKILSLYNNSLTGVLPEDFHKLKNLVEFSIGKNNVTGTIPAGIGQMSNLKILDMHENQLAGPIPKEIGELMNLKVLNFYNNTLEKTIPTYIGKLRKLEELTLDNNDLTGSIPTEIGSVIKLKYLTFSGNQMAGDMPEELGELILLQNLDIRGYSTSGGKRSGGGTIPKSFGKLKKLRYVIFQDNGLTGTLPSELGDLESSEMLWLQGQELRGSFPSELGKLNSLTLLSVANNVLRGTLPESVGNMANLNILDLGKNELTGSIPEEIGNIPGLNRISISDLAISGAIPTSIGNLASLQYFDAANNFLIGQIPTEIGKTQLETLDLSNNRLGGTIPSQIGNATNLTQMNLGMNSLEGSIPSEIGQMEKLTEIDLGTNTLTGTIPSEIGTLTSVETVNLGDNTLNGTIPSEIGNNMELLVIDLGGNELDGNIPSEIAVINSLEVLDIESNSITGEIPSVIGNLANLSDLNLGSNSLNGTIPSEIANIESLEVIDLGGNSLNGNIPSEIATLSNLEIIDLGGNDISGSIPSAFGDLSSLQSIDLSSNQINGTIPTQIGQLESLEIINIGSNDLTGNIPSEIFEIENVEEISIGNNSLNGTIPSVIGNAANLEIIDIGGNGITGTIPPEVGNLQNLTELDLAGNNVNGSLPDEIATIQTLESINIGSTSLSGNLPSFEDLENLEFLDITNTDITLNRTINWDLCYLESTNLEQLEDLDCTNYCGSPVQECVNGEDSSLSCNDSGCSGTGTPVCTELCKIDYSTCPQGNDQSTFQLSLITEENGWETSWEMSDGYSNEQIFKNDKKYASNEVVSVFRCFETQRCSSFKIFNTKGDALSENISLQINGVEMDLAIRQSRVLMEAEGIGDCTSAPTAIDHSSVPSKRPSVIPSLSPSMSLVPSLRPSIFPSTIPTLSPSFFPSIIPSLLPTLIPSSFPSLVPSKHPSLRPTSKPSTYPSLGPTLIPSIYPSLVPSSIPSLFPTLSPSVIPSLGPSAIPTSHPSLFPSESPVPSQYPSLSPTVTPLTCVPFLLQIQLDQHPEEFSWSLTDDNGSLIMEKSYNGQDISQYFEYYFCLIQGCHTLSVNDSWNDGICCEYGEGSYKAFLNNNTFASFEGGDFGDAKNETFCGCLSGHFPVSLELQTDTAGSETSWDLKNSNDQIIFSVPTLQSSTLYNHDVCLQYGCYNFIIHDANNDGICCGKGDGYVMAYRDDYSPLLFERGKFGANYEETFCGCNSERYSFRFWILPQANPQDTTWVLTSESDNSVIERSKPLQTGELFVTDICLLYGCYKLTIHDAGLDGIGQYAGLIDNMVDPIFRNKAWTGDTVEHVFCDCPSNQFLFQVVVATDRNPLETSWGITALDNTTIATSPESLQPETIYKSEYCLVYGCYMFQVRDESGDGLCCGDGNGYFEGYLDNDAVSKFQGSAFGALQEEMFCHCPKGKFPFHLQLKTDQKPHETKWFLQTIERVEIARKRYQQGVEVVHDHNFCLPHGCYFLRIEDLFGDGLCCGNGNGYYRGFLEGDDTITFQGGSFTYVVEEMFCR